MLVTRQIKDVCISTNTSYRTLYRILADPQFQEMFKEAKLKLMDNALLKLRNAADLAVDTLIELCKDQFVGPAIRLAAATRILEFGNNADLTERFASRLEKLEVKTIDAITAEASKEWVDNNSNNTWIDQPANQEWESESVA
jgi:hypothetical protein